MRPLDLIRKSETVVCEHRAQDECAQLSYIKIKPN